MLYYVSVTSANPAEDHESGFVTQQAAQEYAKDLLSVYLQRLGRDKQRRRSEKDPFAAWARYRLVSIGRLAIDSFWADIIGLRSIVISVGGTGNSVAGARGNFGGQAEG